MDLPREMWLDGINASQKGIIIARALLRHLSLPENSTMLCLQEVKRVFICERCAKYGRCTSMSWERLVKHFLEMNEQHEERERKRQELGLDMVIMNDHDLANDTSDTIFASISKRGKEMLAYTPTAVGDRNTYAELSRHTLCAKGHDTNYDGSCFTCTYHMSTNEDFDDYDGPSDLTPVRSWGCELCEKLGMHLKFFSSEIEAHVEQIHGYKLYWDEEILAGRPRPHNPAVLNMKW
ncbi:hypothetical protein SCHPADRAFT_120374 [Schizopora paradoxa]|uniref:Uncharacterized protein n=1 Tax=Schizopora paradoxa TaxID=27342 RepID=A0A0H2SA04_9AGAM|nr:hypothetical protein SCHPADRAFT_120374 [Schizopora paradoxa]